MRTTRNPVPISNRRGIDPRYMHINGSWIPLPPSIIPVVIVKGSDYEMGYQYGQQAGEYIEPVRDSAWVEGLKRLGSRNAILTELEAAEYYIQKHAPEEICLAGIQRPGSSRHPARRSRPARGRPQFETLRCQAGSSLTARQGRIEVGNTISKFNGV